GFRSSAASSPLELPRQVSMWSIACVLRATLGSPLFTQAALELLATQSHGIPRIINNLCFNALSLGYAEQRRTIDRSIMARVAADLDPDGFESESLASVPSPKEPTQQLVERPWFEWLSFDLSGFRTWTTRLVGL